MGKKKSKAKKKLKSFLKRRRLVNDEARLSVYSDCPICNDDVSLQQCTKHTIVDVERHFQNKVDAIFREEIGKPMKDEWWM